MVVSRILLGTSHPQPVALPLWKNYAHFRLGSLPPVGGHPRTLRGCCSDLHTISGRVLSSPPPGWGYSVVKERTPTARTAWRSSLDR
jgi:hypothetical protein